MKLASSLISPLFAITKSLQSLENPRCGAGGKLVYRLDLLQRHGAPGNIHGPPVAILIVLPLPDRLRLHLRKRVRVTQSPMHSLLGIFMRNSMNHPVTHVPYQFLPTVDKSFISTLGAEPVYPAIYLKLNLQNSFTGFSFRPQ